MEIEFCWRQFFEILIIHKPSLGSREIPQKIGPDRVSRFDVYWIQTDKQTNKQAKFIYRYCRDEERKYCVLWEINQLMYIGCLGGL